MHYVLTKALKTLVPQKYSLVLFYFLAKQIMKNDALKPWPQNISHRAHACVNGKLKRHCVESSPKHCQRLILKCLE